MCGAILLTPASAAGQPRTAGADARSPRNANYSIDVRLDPDARILTGRAVLTWRNIAAVSSPDLRFPEVKEIVFHPNIPASIIPAI